MEENSNEMVDWMYNKLLQLKGTKSESIHHIFFKLNLCDWDFAYGRSLPSDFIEFMHTKYFNEFEIFKYATFSCRMSEDVLQRYSFINILNKTIHERIFSNVCMKDVFSARLLEGYILRNKSYPENYFKLENVEIVNSPLDINANVTSFCVDEYPNLEYVEGDALGFNCNSEYEIFTSWSEIPDYCLLQETLNRFK